MEIKKQIDSDLQEADPVEIADRLREIFGYLLELPIKDQDIKLIDQFDLFIKTKTLELSQLKKELKTIAEKCVVEYNLAEEK